MRRAERLFRLVSELRARGTVRAEDLARHLEVSPRTVYRDIAHLQGSGLPIEGAAGVGYLLRPGFDLPPVTFTHDQMDALALGLSLAAALDDPALAAAADEVRAKLQAGLPDPAAGRLSAAPFFALRRSTGAPAHAALLRRAIRKQLVVRLSYRVTGGTLSDRTLRPLAIWSLTEGWMVTGWCEMRRAFRTFRLDRVQGLSLTGDVFAEEPGKTLADFMAQDSCEAEAGQSAPAGQIWDSAPVRTALD